VSIGPTASRHALRAVVGTLLAITSAAAAAHVVDAAERALVSLDPWVIVPLIISAFLYARGTRAVWQRAGIGRGVTRTQVAAFATGWIVVAIALVSPLDGLANELFSVHMVQHELLMAVAAPLLVLGRPLAAWAWGIPPAYRPAIAAVTHRRALRGVWGWVTAPLPAWLLHALALWLWHVPLFFQAALTSDGLHTLQHLSFLVTALLFWWVALGITTGQGRATALLLLLTTMIHTGVLGALLTFSERVWYPAYIGPTSAHGIDPLMDQQLGGLIMWVPAAASYVIVAMYVAAQLLAPVRGPRGA
jgi:putative membrane protein